MHRIGRTGRAEKEGSSVLFYTENELKLKESIEELMQYTIPTNAFPDEVEISKELTPEERPEELPTKNHGRNDKQVERGAATHEKKEKNSKVNQGGSYKRNLAKKYKKAQTRGDKTYHKRQKRG
jgi:ATP-dependent RNA helicase RhlE